MKKEQVINIGVILFQMTLLSMLIFTEFLSGYKAGVAQHLYFKKISYISNYYQGIPLFLQVFLMLGVSALTATGIIRKGGKFFRNLWKFFFLVTALVICFYSPVTRELNIYVHAVITLQLCILLESTRLFVVFRQCRKKKLNQQHESSIGNPARR